MLNSGVTVHTVNNTFVSWEAQLSVFNKFPSLRNSDSIKLFPVSSCDLKYLVLTGQIKLNQEKLYSPAVLIFFFHFVLSQLFFYQLFPHLNFVVLSRIELTFCKHFSWHGVFANMHSISPVWKHIASEIYLTILCCALSVCVLVTVLESCFLSYLCSGF